VKYQHFGQRSRAVINYIIEFESAHGVPPSGEDIATGCGIARTYAYDLLRRMEEEGLIERARIDGRAVGRNLRLTKAAMKAMKETM
jgi:DNA-binding MarR family transcriptional regulator